MSITMHIEGVLLLTIAGALLLSHRKQLYASLPVHAFSHLIQICRHIYIYIYVVAGSSVVLFHNMLCGVCYVPIVGEPYWFTKWHYDWNADGTWYWVRNLNCCHYKCRPCRGAMPGLPWTPDRRLHY